MSADLSFHPVQREKIKRIVNLLLVAFTMAGGGEEERTFNDHHLLTIGLVSFMKTLAVRFDQEAKAMGCTIEIKSKGLKFDNYTDLFCHYLQNGKVKEI